MNYFTLLSRIMPCMWTTPCMPLLGQYAGNQVKYIPNHSIFIIPPAKLRHKGLNPLLKKESIVVEKNRGQLATLPHSFWLLSHCRALNKRIESCICPASVQPTPEISSE